MIMFLYIFGRYLLNLSIEILKDIGYGVNIEVLIIFNNLIILFVLDVF